MNINRVSNFDNNHPSALEHQCGALPADKKFRNNSAVSFTGLHIPGNPVSVLKRISNQILNHILPETVKWNKDSKLNKVVDWVNKPQNNRLVMGIGIFTIPWIDRHNNKVDEDTANISAYRSLAKGTVGLATGFPIRAIVHKYVEKFTNNGKFLDPHKYFTPEIIEKAKFSGMNYRSVFSTVAALAIVSFTNPMLDAPLTNIFSKWLIKRYNDKKTNKEGVQNNTQPNQIPSNNPTNNTSVKPIQGSIWDTTKEFREGLINNNNPPAKGGAVK